MSKKAIAKKQEQVKLLSEELKSAKSFIVFEYQGLKADEITSSRFNLHKTNSKLAVIKNNILERALKEAGFEEILPEITGPNAIAIGFEDEIAAIKEVAELSKEHKFIKIKGAYIDSKFISVDEAKALASIPGREGLYSMLLSCLTSPIRSFLYGLKAISEQKN